MLVVFVLRPLLSTSRCSAPRSRPGERAFIAWFGVRGVGSLYYVAVASGFGVLTGAERELITWMAVATVILSVVLHGVTAGPLNRWANVNVLNPR